MAYCFMEFSLNRRDDAWFAALGRSCIHMTWSDRGAISLEVCSMCSCLYPYFFVPLLLLEPFFSLSILLIYVINMTDMLSKLTILESLVLLSVLFAEMQFVENDL